MTPLPYVPLHGHFVCPLGQQHLQLLIWLLLVHAVDPRPGVHRASTQVAQAPQLVNARVDKRGPAGWRRRAGLLIGGGGCTAALLLQQGLQAGGAGGSRWPKRDVCAVYVYVCCIVSMYFQPRPPSWTGLAPSPDLPGSPPPTPGS